LCYDNRERLFENPLTEDFEVLIGGVLSEGTVCKPGDSNYELMLEILEEIIQSQCENNQVIIEHNVRLVHGRLLMPE
jgi:hypothetical protein